MQHSIWEAHSCHNLGPWYDASGLHRRLRFDTHLHIQTYTPQLMASGAGSQFSLQVWFLVCLHIQEPNSTVNEAIHPQQYFMFGCCVTKLFLEIWIPPKSSLVNQRDWDCLQEYAQGIIYRSRNDSCITKTYLNMGDRPQKLGT